MNIGFPFIFPLVKISSTYISLYIRRPNNLTIPLLKPVLKSSLHFIRLEFLSNSKPTLFSEAVSMSVDLRIIDVKVAIYPVFICGKIWKLVMKPLDLGGKSGIVLLNS